MNSKEITWRPQYEPPFVPSYGRVPDSGSETVQIPLTGREEVRVLLRTMIYAVFLLIFSFCLTACGGVTEDITVDIQPHKAPEKASALSGVPPVPVEVVEVREPGGTGLLPGRIGERKTIGNISMGLVSVSPPVGRLLTDMLRAELTAAGHRLGEGGGKVKITGEIRSFALRTDVTPVYWDVVVDADVVIEAAASGSSETSEYIAQCTERTYLWPGEGIITRVVRACIDDIAQQFRDDQEIAAVLIAP